METQSSLSGLSLGLGVGVKPVVSKNQKRNKALWRPEVTFRTQFLKYQPKSCEAKFAQWAAKERPRYLRWLSNHATPSRGSLGGGSWVYNQFYALPRGPSPGRNLRIHPNQLPLFAAARESGTKSWPPSPRGLHVPAHTENKAEKGKW